MTDKTPEEGQPQQVFVPVTATQAAPEPDKTEGTEKGDKPKKKAAKGGGVPVGQVAAGGAGATVLGSYALASVVGPWGWVAAPAAGAVAGAGYLYHRRRKQRQEKTKTTITRTRTKSSKARGGGFAGFRGRAGSMPGAGKPGVSSTSGKRFGGLSSPAAGKSGAGLGSSKGKSGAGAQARPGGKPAGGPRGSTPGAGGKRAGAGGLFGGKGPGGSGGRKPGGGGLFGGGRKGGGSKGTSGKSPRGASSRGGLFGSSRKTGGSGRGTLGGRRHGGTDPTTSSKKRGAGMSTTQSRWGRARGVIGKGASRLADATKRGARRTGDAADRKTGRRASTAYRAATKPKGLRARWEAARTALAKASGRPWVNRAFAAGAVGVAAVGAAGYRANQWARTRANKNLDRYEPEAAPESTGETTQPLPTPEAEQPQERPEPAAAAAPSVTPTTATAGGTTMAGLPASKIAYDMASSMSRYEPQTAYQVLADARQWPDVSTQVALAVKAYADQLEARRFPINKAINEKLQEFAQAVAATRTVAGELEGLMRKAHADDLARQESPRGDETKWNISLTCTYERRHLVATWSLCTGSVTGNAITAGIAMAAVVAVADTVGMHPLVGVGAAAVGALCTVLMSGFGNAEAIGVHLGRWVAAGLWVTVVLSLSSPWSVGTVGVLVVGCVVGAALGPMVDRHAADTAKQGGGLVLGATAKESEEWRQRITQRGGNPFAGTVVETVTRWENGNGQDVRVCLPRAGATVDQLRYLAPGLAGDANLPHGCSIEVIEPEDEGQRTVIMRVPTRVMTTLDESHPLWEEQRSILDGIPIGAFATGDTVEAPMREESWLVVGKKGSGKTTLLFGITATVGMCRDALVWHIDLNNGALSQPWVDVWLNGQVERCPIDWAAPTIDEAIKMTAAAVRIAKHRKAAYRKRKKTANTNLLPIGEDLPEIVIILDEGAEAMAAAGKGKVVELAANLEEIQRIARDAAVNPILSVLRGTGDLVPAAMKTQTGVAICMKVSEQKEIAQVFDSAWELKLRPEHLTAKGAGWIGIDGATPVRYQGWNILPDDMEQAALRIARVRPDLDAASAEAAGQNYATRYERMRYLFTEEGEIVDEEEPEPAATSGSWTADWDLFGTGPAPSQPRPTVDRTTPPPGDDGIEDAEIIEDVPVDDILIGALRVMSDHGSDRATREQLAARLTGGDEEILKERMKKSGAGSPRPIRINGEYKRGWMRADIEEAARMTPA